MHSTGTVRRNREQGTGNRERQRASQIREALLLQPCSLFPVACSLQSAATKSSASIGVSRLIGANRILVQEDRDERRKLVELRLGQQLLRGGSEHDELF